MTQTIPDKDYEFLDTPIRLFIVNEADQAQLRGEDISPIADVLGALSHHHGGWRMIFMSDFLKTTSKELQDDAGLPPDSVQYLEEVFAQHGFVLGEAQFAGIIRDRKTNRLDIGMLQQSAAVFFERYPKKHLTAQKPENQSQDHDGIHLG